MKFRKKCNFCMLTGKGWMEYSSFWFYLFLHFCYWKLEFEALIVLTPLKSSINGMLLMISHFFFQFDFKAKVLSYLHLFESQILKHIILKFKLKRLVFKFWQIPYSQKMDVSTSAAISPCRYQYNSITICKVMTMITIVL